MENSVIMDDVKILKGARVYTAIVDSDAVISENAVVGSGSDFSEITVIGKGETVLAKKDGRRGDI